MEPRPDGRGKPAWSILATNTGREPQWSPGLMAGGSLRRVPHPPVGRFAAMEPRPDGRGKQPGGRCAVHRAHAAMEPRPDGRGKSTNTDTSAAIAQAAMEPRPDGRGKLADLPNPANQTAPPQWSPGLMAGGRRGAAPLQQRPRRCRNGAPA